DGWTAGHVDFHELPLRDKREEATVRRPERVLRAVGTGQRLRNERIERPDPQQVATISTCRHEREVTTVWRQHEASRRRGLPCQNVLRWQNRCAICLCFNRRSAEKQ